MTDTLTTRQMATNEADLVAASLGEAFADDPLFGWLGGFDQDATRMTRVFQSILKAHLRQGQPRSQVFTTDDRVANAIWIKGAPDPVRMLRVMPALL